MGIYKKYLGSSQKLKILRILAIPSYMWAFRTVKNKMRRKFLKKRKDYLLRVHIYDRFARIFVIFHF